jgi:hypothetical protein
MKIAVSGTAGVGKTTLAQSLAPLLRLDVIEENYQPFFEQAGGFNAPPQQLLPLFHKVFDTKQRLEQDSNNFIADRCPIDLFHLWMTKGLHTLERETDEFFTRCVMAARRYDFIVLPAWGSIGLQQKQRGSGKQRRVMNNWTQLRNHAAIVGYTYLWVPAERIIQLPMPLSDTEQRIHFVLQVIRSRIDLQQARQKPDGET